MAKDWWMGQPAFQLMNTTPSPLPPSSPLPQAAKEFGWQATEAAQRGASAAKDLYQTISTEAKDGLAHSKEFAQHALDATKDAAQHATDAVKGTYLTVATKAEDTLADTRDYVRQHPLPVVLGALALGLTLGCMMGMSQRQPPTFRQRYLW
jgi:ElaB/YqjD/DUF883 family membrane-anchored ribosome-binding protein